MLLTKPKMWLESIVVSFCFNIIFSGWGLWYTFWRSVQATTFLDSAVKSARKKFGDWISYKKTLKAGRTQSKCVKGCWTESFFCVHFLTQYRVVFNIDMMTLNLFNVTKWNNSMSFYFCLLIFLPRSPLPKSEECQCARHKSSVHKHWNQLEWARFCSRGGNLKSRKV